MRRILVVEDSPTQAQQLRLLLEGAGYAVDWAADGQAGLERVKVSPPDLIISDLVMPRMDGHAFCAAVKASKRTRRIPFVLLTERREPVDIVKGLERGADNFITRPFEDEYLLERIRRIFEQVERRRVGQLEIEVGLRVGEREITISADKQQIIELLFSTFEELCRLNGQLVDSKRVIEDHARELERQVQERTRRLLQSEKLAWMGQLLAGVAHELNNPLSIVLGQAMLLRETAGPGPVAERAEKITRAGERCARIVRNFLALARERPPERREVQLGQVVAEAVELLAYQLRVDGVEVGLDLAGNLPALSADPHQLHQVMVNLISNAQHAMRGAPSPRRLSISARADAARSRVFLEVADTGPGIPPEVQARIFEPFFTTKPVGEGTGLGLSLCRTLVEQHGGSIRAESQPGEGTVFVIELPVQVPPATPPEAQAANALPPIRDKAILVVDDEEQIATLLADILSMDGHRVDTAANGRLALDALRGGTYDLIVSDVRMPELDGPGLYREVGRLRPELLHRFVFVTGDVLSADTAAFLQTSEVLRMAKPFSAGEVQRVVQQALRRAAPEPRK